MKSVITNEAELHASVLFFLCVSRMQSRARAVAMIGAGSSLLTLDQIAWSLSGILVLGACTFFLDLFSRVCALLPPAGDVAIHRLS